MSSVGNVVLYHLLSLGYSPSRSHHLSSFCSVFTLCDPMTCLAEEPCRCSLPALYVSSWFIDHLGPVLYRLVACLRVRARAAYVTTVLYAST